MNWHQTIENKISSSNSLGKPQEKWKNRGSLTPPMFREDLEQMKAELKEAIRSKYEIDRSFTGAYIDERLLDDEAGKHTIFEDPDIYDLLEVYVTSLPHRENQPKSDEALWEEFEDILREMTMDAEGIVA